LKAFSVGSCQNKCGSTVQDCSCTTDCLLSGTCCSDYHECEEALKNNKGRLYECQKKVDNCEFCDFSNVSRVSCKQCKPGFFLRNGQCVNSCFPSDSLMAINKICLKNQDCLVDNCSECVDGNSAVCKYCKNGFFMYNNQCLSMCPYKFRADRISWVCLEPPVFAWYWIFPSRTSCLNSCGKPMLMERDCSCHEDCFRFGNCCQDIEDYCSSYAFWK